MVSTTARTATSISGCFSQKLPKSFFNTSVKLVPTCICLCNYLYCKFYFAHFSFSPYLCTRFRCHPSESGANSFCTSTHRQGPSFAGCSKSFASLSPICATHPPDSLSLATSLRRVRGISQQSIARTKNLFASSFAYFAEFRNQISEARYMKLRNLANQQNLAKFIFRLNKKTYDLHSPHPSASAAPYKSSTLVSSLLTSRNVCVSSTIRRLPSASVATHSTSAAIS